MSDKVRENRLRRMAERQGYQLVKSRRRDSRAVDFGCYGLSDIRTNTAIFGFGVAGLEASLDEIEQFLTDGGGDGAE